MRGQQGNTPQYGGGPRGGIHASTIEGDGRAGLIIFQFGFRSQCLFFALLPRPLLSWSVADMADEDLLDDDEDENQSSQSTAMDLSSQHWWEMHYSNRFSSATFEDSSAPGLVGITAQVLDVIRTNFLFDPRPLNSDCCRFDASADVGEALDSCVGRSLWQPSWLRQSSKHGVYRRQLPRTMI